ncbi:MAG TPA: stage II sporulation protein M [Clostridiaceae bacterium]|nr:stage II sporulation protein M [Clostridiaceae bacterium]
MLFRARGILARNLKTNSNKYVLLFLSFVAGIIAGAFTVNGLNPGQSTELENYFFGFLHLINYQNIDSVELFKITMLENLKLIAVLWGLGVTIIGIPFIYIVIGIKGFISGFSSGFIIEAAGLRGILFVIAAMLPKELIQVPCLVALGVSGINFSLNILRSRSHKLPFKSSLKSEFFTYCLITALFFCLITAGALLEAYVSPMLVKMLAPLFENFK